MNGHVVDKIISAIRFAEPVSVYKHDSIEINFKRRQALIVNSVGRIRQKVNIEVEESWENDSNPAWIKSPKIG